MRALSLVIVFAVVFTFTAAAAPASAAAANPCPETYIVRWGDTLARIAQRCDISVARLLVANPHIKNPDRIIAGQLLNIPGPREHTTVFRQVNAYLIALGEGTPGNIGCGDAPVAVTRNVRPTTAPLTAAIQELISIRGNYYGQSGLFNPLWQSNLRIQSVTLVSGKATVRLTGTFVINGPCQGAGVKAQFDRTALQFSTVKSVKVYINGRPLVDILSEEA